MKSGNRQPACSYVLNIQIRMLQNMLAYLEYSLAQNAAVLMLGSQSYFTCVCHTKTGFTRSNTGSAWENEGRNAPALMLK